MTHVGVIHLVSLFYLSGIICLSVSLNENRAPKMIIRETARRWAKFLVVTFVIALGVHLMSR